MPLALALIGIMLAVSGIRGTVGELGKQITDDFRSGFIYWLGSIAIVGAIGISPYLKTLSRTFLALLVIVLFLRLNGQSFFGNLQKAFDGIGSGGSVKPLGDGNKPSPQGNSNPLAGIGNPLNAIGNPLNAIGNPLGRVLNNVPFGNELKGFFGF